MFEKFTEKAINLIFEAQNQAKELDHAFVQPEHLLLALSKQAKGISLKILKTYDVTFERLKPLIVERLKFERSASYHEIIPFGDGFKEILKNSLDLAIKSGNNYVLFEHLFICVLTDKKSYVSRILEQFNFDNYKSKELLLKLVEKKSKKFQHPEAIETKKSNGWYLESALENEHTSKIFEKAVAKLYASNYEILGTEQVLSSILEDENENLSNILKEYGITSEKFEQILSEEKSREAEFEQKKIIFTPNAFLVMNTALETAKELGSSEVTAEHIILGILKTKKGLAYNVLKKLNINDDNLAHAIIKPIEKEMPQALTILRLAKQEARRLGRNIVGTEMILLGILAEASSKGAKVLNELEITTKDARTVIENLIGFGNEYFDKELVYTKRAKKVLERAWNQAKKEKQTRILSEHLLFAITEESSCLAMQALEQLGVDAIEIKQGISKQSND